MRGRFAKESSSKLLLGAHCLSGVELNIVMDSEHQQTWSQPSRVYTGLGGTQGRRKGDSAGLCGVECSGDGKKPGMLPRGDSVCSELHFDTWMEHLLIQANGEF